MDNKNYIFFVILAFSMPNDTESTLESKSHTACYGILGLVNYLQPSCPGDEKIVVMAVYALAKNKSTGCPQQQIGPIDPSCCQYDVKDCSVLYNSGPYRNYYQTCNGKSSCQIPVSWIDIPSHCNSSVYIERTHYMKMDYYCISDQAVDPCTDLRTSDSPAFFWNTGYPAEMTATKTSCTCSIEMSCDTTVELTAIDLQLEHAGNCNQSFTVTDSSSLSTFDCSKNNDFLPQVIYTSSGHFMTILFENNLGKTGGKFLTQVKGTNPTGVVTLSCGASTLTMSSQNPNSLPTCPVKGGKTTNIPTAGPSTQTEDSTTLKAVSSDSSSVSPTISTMYSTFTARTTEDSSTSTVWTTKDSTTSSAQTTSDSTASTPYTTKDSTISTALITEDSTKPTAQATEDSIASTDQTTEDSTKPTDQTNENSTKPTDQTNENSTKPTTLATEDSTKPTTKKNEDSTTSTARTTEDSIASTARTTEDSTTSTTQTTRKFIKHTVLTTEDSKKHTLQTNEHSATLNVLTTGDSTKHATQTTQNYIASTALTTEDSTVTTAKKTEDSTVTTAQKTKDSTVTTAQKNEDSTVTTAKKTEDATAPITEDSTTLNNARTTEDLTTTTAQTTEDSTFSTTSFPNVQTEDSTQDITSESSLNMTVVLNVSIENTSDAQSDHTTPPQTSTDLPTVTAAEPCCKDSNTTKKTHISSSGSYSVNPAYIAVGILLAVVLFIGIVIGIFCCIRRD